MAQNHKAERSPEEENKIPVFTVVKNNVVLKNIFLLDNPPSNSKPGSTQPKEIDLDQENEEMFVIGRHPDCDITVEHPSISRFHLRIHSYPSLQKLAVTDLSSVHGTWVSGRKIEARVPVELNEGDTLRIGGSSRVYWLHWIPLSQAYDLDNPFVPADKDGGKYEDEHCLLVQNDEIQTVDPVWEADGLEKEEKRHQENCLSVENEEVESLHTVVESMGSLFFDKNLEPSFRKEIPSVPLLPSDMISPFLSLFVDEGQQVDDANKFDQIPSLPEMSSSSLADEVDIFHFSSESFEEIQKPSSLIDGDEQIKTLTIQAKIDEERCDEENKIAHSSLVTEENLSADLPEISVSSLFDKEGKPQFSTEIFEEIQNPISFRDSSIEQVKFLIPQSKTEEHQCDKENEISQSPFHKENLPVNLSADLPEISVSSLFDKEGKPQFSTEIFGEIQNPISFLDSSNEQVKFLIPQSKIEEHQCHKENNISQSPFGKENLPVNLPEIAISSLSNKQGLDKPLFFSEMFEEIQKPSSLRNNDEQIKTLSTHSSTEERQCDEENISQFPLDKAKLSENPESPPIRSERDSKLPSIWSRRGKPTSAVTVRTGKLTDYVEDVKENSIPRVLFSPLDVEEKEEETFTPDKENVTPNTRRFKFMENRKLEAITNSMSARGSCFNVTNSPGFSSGKENQTPKNVLLEQKKAKPASLSGMKLNSEVMVGKGKSDRMPFQSLPVNSTGKSNTEASAINATTATSDSVNCVQRMEKISAGLSCKFSDKEDMVRWNMVVDTASLLNKESRKSLQLLQGLKGTQLIIPRIVVRELDCLNRRGSLFRRKTEVSSVLQWIEDCMVKTKWWIHVQSCTEERPVAPTPPASPPRSRLSDGASMEFSSYESLMEAIVSPTAEDHILESALFFRSIQNGHLILLSNDVTLKIKAMAEGLICETAEEFRESLVNPFSERFMWSESSPRGQTWSCLDDVVLREKYNKHHCCPFKKPANWGESAKGLKLILLHNSQYGKDKISLAS